MRRCPMKLWNHMALVSMLALATPACIADSEMIDEGDEIAAETASEDVGEAEQAVCQWNEIYHYNYTDGSGTYRWNVSYNYSTATWYVDEKKIGGTFYKQYVLTPYWTICP